MPSSQDSGDATSNDPQGASDDDRSEAGRANDSVSPVGVQDSSPKFPLHQGELPPALPDDMVNLISITIEEKMQHNVVKNKGHVLIEFLYTIICSERCRSQGRTTTTF